MSRAALFFEEVDILVTQGQPQTHPFNSFNSTRINSHYFPPSLPYYNLFFLYFYCFHPLPENILGYYTVHNTCILPVAPWIPWKMNLYIAPSIAVFQAARSFWLLMTIT